MEQHFFDKPRSAFMPTQFPHLVGVLNPIGEAASSLLGKHYQDLSDPFSPEGYEMAHNAAVSPVHLQRWISRLLTVDDEGKMALNPANPNIKVNLQFLSQLRDFPTSVLEDGTAKRLDAHIGPQMFINKLYQLYPVTASNALLLYDHFKKVSDVDPKGRKYWYETLVDNTVETDRAIAEAMKRIKYRQNRVVGDPFADSYLNDFESDIRLHNAEVLNAGNAMGIFAASIGSDGYIVHAMRVGLSSSDFNYYHSELGRYDQGYHSDGRPAALSNLAKYVFESNRRLNPDDHEIKIPMLIGSYDLLHYSELLRSYWEEIAGGIHPTEAHRDSAKARGEASIKIGSRGSLFMREAPKMESGRQVAEARVSLQLGGVSIRTDCDYRRMVMSMDFGHATVDDAWKYMDRLQQIDESTSLDEVLSSFAKTKRYIDTYGYGPSVMKPLGAIGYANGWQDTLTDAHKMAIMASVVSMSGEDSAMRLSMDGFGYHTREHVNKKEYLDNFPRIVSAIKQALTTSLR